MSYSFYVVNVSNCPDTMMSRQSVKVSKLVTTAVTQCLPELDQNNGEQPRNIIRTGTLPAYL